MDTLMVEQTLQKKLMSIQEQKPSKKKTLREKKNYKMKRISVRCRKTLSSLICLQRGERGQTKYLIIMFTITASTLYYNRGSSQCNQAKKEIKREEKRFLKRRNKTTFIYRQYDHLCRISIGIWKKTRTIKWF